MDLIQKSLFGEEFTLIEANFNLKKSAADFSKPFLKLTSNRFLKKSINIAPLVGLVPIET